MTLFESAYKEVSKLAKIFEANEKYYLSKDYAEAEVRRGFIDKFWKALGWDVYHDKQTNPSEYEVRVERQAHVASTRKADYAFYLAPEYKRPVFLVEAKQPTSDLAKPENYFQTARYGFMTSTTVAILTDFHELHVIDCRRKPQNVTGIVNSARLEKFTYRDYLDKEKFGWIYWHFSREAVAEGKLKAYWKDLRKKPARGTSKQLRILETGFLAPPDDEFLEDLDRWRKDLASEFKKRNRDLTPEGLTEVAQKVLDRLVFIRFLEDKQIVPDPIIEKFLKPGSAWSHFVDESRVLDRKYNGVVFKDHDIDHAEKLQPPSDEKFLALCDELNSDNSPYAFVYFSPEILGSIYERFLGKVVVERGSGIAVDYKPEVRKAGGVYYTPKYIVDYIVENTVGKLLIGKTPEEISKLRFADIACGSGSFLLSIFDHIIHYLENWYHRHPDEAKKNCRKGEDDSYILTLKQKRNILKENIFGVDIDPQAVEVAQFSLFLKLLESENIRTVEEFAVPLKKSSAQLTITPESPEYTAKGGTVLPDISTNIKLGNSLIERDIENLFELTAEEEHRIKPFNFQTKFKQVMDTGKFDGIVGNPPYFSLTTVGQTQKDYFAKKYKTYDNSTDIYCLFIEKSLSLLKDNGYACYITSNQWLQTNYGKILRNFLVANSNPEKLINFGGYKVFQSATVDTSILLIKKQECKYDLKACHVKSDFNISQNLSDYFEKHMVKLSDLMGERWYIIDKKVSNLKNKISRAGQLLKSHKIKINYGIKTGYNEAFIISDEKKVELCNLDKNSYELLQPLLRGRDVHRYNVEFSNLWLIVTKNGIDIKKYKAIYDHLSRYKSELVARADQGDNWWNLRACIYYDDFDKEKIIYPETTVRRGEFFLDKNKYFIDKTCFMITGADLPYLNGILSSRLMNWYLESELRLLGKNSIQYSKQFIEKIPIKYPDLANSSDKSKHDEFVKFVEQMIETKRRLGMARFVSERAELEGKCEDIDHEIDIRVYEMYGLSEEEIKVVEGVQ